MAPEQKPKKIPYVAATGDQPERARLALLSDLKLDSPLLGKKVRTAGRTLAVDRAKTQVVLEHEGSGLLVDLSLPCQADGHLPRLRDVIVVIGELEQRDPADHSLPPLQLPHQSVASLTVDARVVLTAIMLIPTKDDNELELRSFAERVALANEE